MFRKMTTGLSLLGMFAASVAVASESRGVYLETRTCQVFTGPCFANAETGLAGHDAIMAWRIEQGQQDGVDISGLNVVVVVRSSDTLGFQGLSDARQLRSIVLLDQRASEPQQAALVEFVRTHAQQASRDIARVSVLPIHMDLNVETLKGQLTAGKEVTLETRKARQGDCICSNEVAYYPPLAKVEHFVPGVTEVGEFKGRGLGSRWSTPESRS
jgi:hypothetical protein